jgi:hypothetical protein
VAWAGELLNDGAPDKARPPENDDPQLADCGHHRR